MTTGGVDEEVLGLFDDWLPRVRLAEVDVDVGDLGIEESSP